MAVFSSHPHYFNVSFNQHASIKLKNGKQIWGTSRGVLMFEPDAVLLSSSEGRIFFQDIVISGRSLRNNPHVSINTPLDELQKISLKYNQNTLTLDFIPIGSTSLYSKFSWKMEGIDEEWTEPSSSRAITYASMPSGDYSLKIRMYDSTLNQIINERSLQIHITSLVEYSMVPSYFVFTGYGYFIIHTPFLYQSDQTSTCGR